MCRSRNFCQGGGGGGGGGGFQPRLPENSSDKVFFSLVLNLFYSFTSKRTIIFQGFRGGPTFSRGGGIQLFPGGGGGGGSK